jgi:hypothetical protein
MKIGELASSAGAALRQLIASRDAHGRPEECALMHAVGGDPDRGGTHDYTTP